MAEKLQELANLAGVNIIFLDTYRSWDEQDYLYAKGRTSPGRIVTKARGGESWHNWGLAFDFAVLDPGNRAINWDGSCNLDGDDKKDYEEVGEIAESLGMKWGGRWGWDFGHVEWHPNLEITHD